MPHRSETTPPHVFDTAVALQPARADQGGDDFLGHTSPAYWNMIGPFGGITAAVALNAVLQHPQLLGEPVAITVNYAGPVGEGPFTARARPARTNRSTQHWWVELLQAGADGEESVSTTATVVTAARRTTWGASDAPMPAVPAPADVARSVRPGNVAAWLARYEVRTIEGDIPQVWEGQHAQSSLSRWWLRDDPPRPLDFASLTAMADVFFPRVWLKRATRVPVGTVSMTVYFHADGTQLAANGPQHLLAEARAQAFRDGFFDQTGLLWGADGRLLCSTHQVVYYKE